MKRIWKIIFILIILYMIIHIEIITAEKQAPEKVLIRVLKADNLTPEVNADCKADIITQSSIINDKKLSKIESMFEYIDIYKFDINQDEGFYELDTGLINYKGKFEIRIICISPGYKGVSYTILNNTNIPCELKNNGKFVIC